MIDKSEMINIMKTSVILGSLFVVLLFMASSAPLNTPPFSVAIMNEINTFLDFNKVKQDPEAYKGQVILLGGAVVTVKSFLESPLQIEVVQGPLDSQDVPTLKSSSGRFFVLSKEAPNPETVLKDQLCRMVIGEIDGVQYQEIGGLGHLPFNKG